MQYLKHFFSQKFPKLSAIHQAHYAEDAPRQQSHAHLVWFIIFLVIASQLSLTIYLPSMPPMVHYFKTNIAHLQLSITVYLIGYGVSQFFYGPLSDIYGRRAIVLVGLTIFTMASLVCLVTASISLFLIARMVQGIGIGCGDTMGRAILCDRFKDHEFVQAACHIGLAATVIPMLGPVLGGYIEAYTDWRISFLIIFIYGASILVLLFVYLPETKPRLQPAVTSLRGILNMYVFILRNRFFLAFFIPGMVSFLGETAYNLTSTFLLQNNLQWGPVAFGWLNILTVIGLLSGTLVAHYLSQKVGYLKMVLVGMYLLSSSAVLMLLFSLFHLFNTTTLLLPMIVFMAGVGITYPNTNMGALAPFTTMAGTAGALQGGLQMLLGSALGLFMSKINIHTQFPLAIILSVLSLVGLGIFIVLLMPEKVGIKIDGSSK